MLCLDNVAASHILDSVLMYLSNQFFTALLLPLFTVFGLVYRILTSITVLLFDFSV